MWFQYCCNYHIHHIIYIYNAGTTQPKGSFSFAGTAVALWHSGRKRNTGTYLDSDENTKWMVIIYRPGWSVTSTRTRGQNKYNIMTYTWYITWYDLFSPATMYRTCSSPTWMEQDTYYTAGTRHISYARTHTTWGDWFIRNCRSKYLLALLFVPTIHFNLPCDMCHASCENAENVTDDMRACCSWYTYPQQVGGVPIPDAWYSFFRKRYLLRQELATRAVYITCTRYQVSVHDYEQS